MSSRIEKAYPPSPGDLTDVDINDNAADKSAKTAQGHPELHSDDDVLSVKEAVIDGVDPVYAAKAKVLNDAVSPTSN
jgi:hypothetical protein